MLVETRGINIMQKQYETERLELKTLDRSFAGLILDYYERNKAFMEEWEATKCEDYFTVPYQEKLLEKDLNDMENGRCLRLWIFKKGGPDRIIGMVAFNNIVRGAFLSCHMGYRLERDELNKGYISEAVQKGIDVMFSEYGLHRIEANIMPKNTASLRVAEKAGFYNEGLAYKYLKINGKWEDHIHMVLRNSRME